MARTPAVEGTTVRGTPNGFVLRSADINFVVQLGGVLQVDSRSFLDDAGIVSHGSRRFTPPRELSDPNPDPFAFDLDKRG